MGITARFKYVFEKPEMLKFFARSGTNEFLLLLRRGRLGAAASYAVAGITGVSLYDKYLDRVARSSGDAILVEARDYEMLIDPTDKGLSKQLYLYGTREKGPADVFEEEVAKINDEVESPLVVEPGANIGFYTILTANAIGRSGEIISIEPSQGNIDLLEKNIGMQGLDDLVSVHRCAIGGENGEAKLEISEQSNLHRVSDDARSDGEVESVSMWRLDDFVEDQGHDPSDVNVVRMDIEGQEVKALDGMAEILDGDGPTLLFIEVHNHMFNDPDACELPRKLANAGFDIIDVQWGTITNTPLDLSFDVDGWGDLHEIDTAYALIAKKSA